MTTDFDRMLQNGYTAAFLTQNNPVPLVRELMLETDTGMSKVGDGVTAWNALPYAFDSRYVIRAPAPSGGDDTGALTNVINAAAASNGTVQLHPGTYLCNLLLADGYHQATIRGAGRNQTTLQGYGASTPVVKMRGGSGAVAGGGLYSLTVVPASGGGGTGVEFSGVTLCDSRDIAIMPNPTNGVFDYGVVFHNEDTGDFTEFCTLEAAIYNAKIAVRYYSSNGVESFHGSGLIGNSVIGLASSSLGAVQIENDSNPYNAPMSVTVFYSSNTQFLFNNLNATSSYFPHFHGTIRSEASGAALTNILGQGNNRVFLQGNITLLGGSSGLAPTLGNIFLVEKMVWGNGVVAPTLKQHSFNIKCDSSPVQATFTPTGGALLIDVTLTAPNYVYSYLLHAFQYPANSSGTVSVVANSYAQNGGGAYGPPTFSWNGGLYITNANYPAKTTSNPVIAYVNVTPLGAEITSLNLPQYIQ